MSLDYLIRLSQRTGDRLIIHDEFGGQDIAILPITEYEKLVDKIEMCEMLHSEDQHDEFDFPFDPPSFDYGEISPPSFDYGATGESWREGGIPFGPEPKDEYDFEDVGDWDRVGDVLEDRYDFPDDDSEADYFSYGDEGLSLIDDEMSSVDDWEPPRFDWHGNEMEDDVEIEDIPPFSQSLVDEEVKIEDIPFSFESPFSRLSRFNEAGESAVVEEVRIEDIPFEPVATVGDWEEEPLPSEEPVFYEEPV